MKTDLLSLVREKVENVKLASPSRNEWESPCPFCGGKNRFRIFANDGEGGNYWCRICNKRGDAIQLLRDIDGLSYREACQELGVKRKPFNPNAPRRVDGRNQAYEFKKRGTVSAAWVTKAQGLVSYAHDKLLMNRPMIEYLAGRGIPFDAVKYFKLGYLPDTYFRSRESWGLEPKTNAKGNPSKLWIPAGLVIPTYENGNLVRIRVRQKDGFTMGEKYVVVSGSAMQPMVIRPDADAFVLNEAELDAIASAWASRDLNVGAIALGSLQSKPDADLNKILASCMCVLNALDFEPVLSPKDEKEKKTAQIQGRCREWWQKTYKHCKRHPVPEGKDVGDAFKLGVDLIKWICAGLPNAMKLKIQDRKQKKQQENVHREACNRVVNSENNTKVAHDNSVPEGVRDLRKMMAGYAIYIDTRNGFSLRADWDSAGWREYGETVFKPVHAKMKQRDVIEWLAVHFPNDVVTYDKLP